MQGPCVSSDIAAVASHLTRRPPATPAERAGLCKVLSAADWLHEKFLRDASASPWPDDDTEGSRVINPVPFGVREAIFTCVDADDVPYRIARVHAIVIDPRYNNAPVMGGVCESDPLMVLASREGQGSGTQTRGSLIVFGFPQEASGSSGM